MVSKCFYFGIYWPLDQMYYNYNMRNELKIITRYLSKLTNHHVVFNERFKKDVEYTIKLILKYTKDEEMTQIEI